MNVGSLIACIDNAQYAQYGMAIPDTKATYTLKEIVPKGTKIQVGKYTIFATEALIYIEELKNNNINIESDSGIEPAYCMKDFRELMPPEAVSIEELMKATIKQFA